MPHKGKLFVTTLMGKLVVEPKEILIIPRGIKFTVDVEGDIKGWIAELYGHHLSLPELGPIGANGLANPKDFLYPTAWFEDKKEEWTVHSLLCRLSTSTLGRFIRPKARTLPTMSSGGEGTMPPANTTWSFTIQLAQSLLITQIQAYSRS